jgi:CHAT domain-containing protein
MSKILLPLILLSFFFSSQAQSWKEDYARAKSFYANENFDEAFKFAQNALTRLQSENGSATNENYSALLRLLSTISYSQEKYKEGLEFSQKEIALRSTQKDTTYAGALANQAQFYKQLGEFDKAINSLIECRTVLLNYYSNNDFVVIEVRLELGISYFLQNDFANAASLLQVTLASCEQQNKFPSNSLEAYYDLAMIQSDNGQLDQAEKNFQSALKLYESSQLDDPSEFSSLHYGLATVLSKKGMYDAAEVNFLKAQEFYEKSGDKTSVEYFHLINSRADNFELMGKDKEAEELFVKIRSGATDAATLAFSLSNSAAAYQAKKEYAKAESLYREALSKYNLQKTSEVIGYCETLENLALLYSEKGDQNTAITTITEAKDRLEKISATGHKRYLSVLNKYALVLDRKGAFAEAFNVYKSVLGQVPLITPEPRAEKISALNGLASLKQKRGNFDGADSIYQSIIHSYKSGTTPADASYLFTLNNYAASKQAQGELISAQKLMRELVSVTASSQGKTNLRYGKVLENLAILNLKSGDLSNAKIELDSVLLIYERTAGKESVEYANCSISIGKYYQLKGDYVKAEPIIRNARNVIQLKEGKDDNDYVTATNSLALLYQTLGNYKDALSLLTEEKSIVEKINGKNNVEYSTCLQNIATLYQLDGKLDQAEPLLKEAMAIDKQVLGENHPQYAVLLQNLATLYQKTGKQNEALSVLNTALEITGRTLGNEHPTYIVMLSNLASAFQDQQNFEKAEALWQQSLNLRKKILGEQHPDYAYSLFGVAGVYHAQHRFNEARKYYEPVVEYYLKQIKELFPSLSEKEKGAFYARIKPIFDSYQDFCIEYSIAFADQRGDVLKKLYNSQLATKAILFNASNKVRSRILTSSDTSLKKLYTQWIASKEEIVRYIRSSQEERVHFSSDLGTLEQHANDLEKKISSLSEDFRAQSENENLTWEEVQRNLQEKEAAVEILRIKKRYVKDSIYYAGLIVKKNEAAPEIVIWPLGKQLEGRRFKYHRNTIKFHFTDTLSYRYFWQPLQANLTNVLTIFLSCDGVFNKVNFNSLFSSKQKRWVIDDFTIRQLSSTRELLKKSQKNINSQGSASLFGNVDFNLGEPDQIMTSSTKRSAHSFGFEGESIPALPGTEVEIKGIGSILAANQWAVETFDQKNATEEAVKKIKSPNIFHIATHGFFLSDIDFNENEEAINNPLFRSGVLLAGAAIERSVSKREEDGVLTAYEAMNLDLDKTDLVVLSACETGLGEVRNGEGVYGLQRSFMVAGARNVLMSLWQVDDKATQELMNAFYSYWVEGKEKHQAFREAQLKIKEQYPSPYFWGAFVLVGN